MEHTRRALGLDELADFDRMAVCLEGHVINDRVVQRPTDNSPHCTRCGAEVIDECQSCSEPIRGAPVDRRPEALRTQPLGPKPARPSNCRSCGEPFPWDTSKKDQAEVEDDDVDAVVVYAAHKIMSGATFGVGHLLEAVPRLSDAALVATADEAARRGYFAKNDKRLSLTLDGQRHANRVLDRVGIRKRLYGMDFASGRPTLPDALLLYALSSDRPRGPIWFEELYVQFPASSTDAIKGAIRRLRDDGLMTMYDQTFIRRVANGERRIWEFELASAVTAAGIRRRASLLDDRNIARLMEDPVNVAVADRVSDVEVEEFLRAVPRGLRELAAEHRYDGRPPYSVDDEYDLQDFVRAFLKMRFPKATFEDSVGKVAGQGGRVDFAVGGEKMFVELKVFKSERDWKKTMLPDITSKIERYARDPKCETFLILVYDPNHKFRDAAAAEADMSGPRTIGGREIEVRLIVTPQP